MITENKYLVTVPAYTNMFSTHTASLGDAILLKAHWLQNHDVIAVILDPDGYIVPSTTINGFVLTLHQKILSDLAAINGLLPHCPNCDGLDILVDSKIDPVFLCKSCNCVWG